jgi:hypothetical protein
MTQPARLRRMKEDELEKSPASLQGPYISSQRLFYYLPLAVSDSELHEGHS